MRCTETTSHQLQTFFREQAIDPKINFPQFYTAKFPDVAVTSQWIRSLDELLRELGCWKKDTVGRTCKSSCEKTPIHEKILEEATFWVAIFFVDQTGRKDVTEDLRIANEIYQHAILHAAMGSETLLTR
mmetsp:Transcript_11265/g.26577  ORF Transcript_11265/g.26577 Transcript_11265/m.26577 type:complete len:129 (+) Transcript_11265:175-561(+)